MAEQDDSGAGGSEAPEGEPLERDGRPRYPRLTAEQLDELGPDEPLFDHEGRGPKAAAERAADPAGLSQFERCWVEEFFRSYPEHRTLAAITKAAGMPSDNDGSLRQTGYQIKKRPHVAAEIARIKAQIAEDALLDATGNLVDIKRSADAAHRDGQFAAAIRGKELIGKELHGQFGDKLDVRVEAGVQRQLEAARVYLKNPESYGDFLQALEQAYGVARMDSGSATDRGSAPGAAGSAGAAEDTDSAG